MSADRNKAIVRRFVEEIFVRRDPKAVDELVSTRFVPHSWPGVPPGTEGLKQAIARVSAGLSGVRMEIEDLIAEGDRVAVRLTAHAVHSGTFMGMPATGRSYTISEIHVFRLAGGKVTEHWHVADLLGMMRQLGLLPTAGTAGRQGEG